MLAPKPMGWFLRLVLRSRIRGITLPPFGIYVREGHEDDAGLKAHEQVHWTQYERMGLMRFYVTYLWYLLRYGYQNHPMEIEARNQSGVA